jgi:hypothetical protein
LRKISGLNLTSWNYIGHDQQRFRHYGPMAQEFFAAFGHDAVGTVGTPTTINSGDLDGILLTAVQALAQEQQEQLRAQARQLADDQATIADLQARLARLESLWSAAAAGK